MIPNADSITRGQHHAGTALIDVLILQRWVRRRREPRLPVMSYIDQMLSSHPVKPSSDHKLAVECITATYSCAEACNACADACLGEKEVHHQIACIRLDQDCADICLATARVISRLTATNKELVGAQLRACAAACGLCAEECERHAEMMEHCRICAEACRRCEKACHALLGIDSQAAG